MTNSKFYLPAKYNHNISSKKIAYINARIIDAESKTDIIGGLITEGNLIADLGEQYKSADALPAEGIDEIIDCKGHILAPGIVDIQVHFRDPGQSHKETIVTGSMASAAGGITSVVCQPNTKPVLDNAALIEYITKKGRDEGYCNVFAYGAISQNMEGKMLTEMQSMAEAGAVGFTDDGLPVMNAQLMRRAMEYAASLDLPIAQHAEDLNLTDGGCMNEGFYSTKMGVPGIPNASEAVIVARDILLQELTGCHYHVLHVSTKEALKFIARAKADGQNVTCEISPHHFTLTDAAVDGFNTLAKMNPPLRSEEDRVEMEKAVLNGLADAIATDHAPHDSDSKELPLETAAFGIIGVETMLPLSLKLYHDGKISLLDLFAQLTYQPADIIRQKQRGRLAKGKIADLILIDIDREWVFDKNTSHSKSKNSPFLGQTMKGQAIMTILGGVKVYELT